MDKKAKIYVAGHEGLVGSALVRRLTEGGYSNLVCKSYSELDLTRQMDVEKFFSKTQPEYVLLAAARVGGINANSTFPADFIRDNILIQTNVLDAAYRYGVKKLLFLGSSCIYPKFAPQPLKEEYLLTGDLEPTNDAYAIAKIAGIKMCQAYNKQYGCNFISVMPTNLYGMGDNFDLATSHVLPALIRKFHEAKINNRDKVVIWGSGTPLREFLYVDDLADACLFLMNKYNSSDIVNIGWGKDLTINELANKIKQVTGYKGEIVYDSSQPDGTPRKVLDVSRLDSMGWKAKTSLDKGIGLAYEWFVKTWS
ncbi:MAG: GDP-L-fucose synthase [Syntrophomonas sp.]